MSNHVSGKSIIITGAGNGFGRLAARKAAALGALVTCADIDVAAAEAVAAEIRDGGGKALAVRADVADIDDMRAVAAAAVSAHGAIDVIVNNAGIMPLAFIADHAAAFDAWNRCIDINFKGVMNGVVAAFDQMMAQGRGHVVNISSIFGNRGAAGGAVYGATKAAVDYFSDALRQEGRGRIKVTVIKPTGVSATGLAGTVINPEAGMGILGHNVGEFFKVYERLQNGDAPAEWSDPQSIGYSSLDPEHIADAIVHAVDQPWGIAISDMTVRASADFYVL
jgi:NADP-dependent 3-hydroxy acid dehydrogenase YdfG